MKAPNLAPRARRCWPRRSSCAVTWSASLLSAAPIVLLDEPTEGLDEPTAAAVLGALCAAAGDRAIVMATHRPADAAVMDRVLVLHEGRLIEQLA